MMPPKALHSTTYHTLFTIPFIKNFINFNIDRNTNWKKYTLERGMFKNARFGFRLIDLEYILEGFSDIYRENYLDDINFVCNPKSIVQLGID